MEKDNFEEYLKRIVVKADENPTDQLGRERVWKNVQPKRKNKLFWYVAAAVIIMLFSFVLYFNQGREISVIKEELITENALPIPFEKKLNDNKITAPQPAQKLNAITNKQPKIDTNVKVTSEKTIVIPAQQEVLMAKNPTVVAVEQSNPVIVQQPIEPTFTVQFKRGASTAVKNEDVTVSTVFKKFMLKRDTTYFASSAEKQPSKIKLNFKKEN